MAPFCSASASPAAQELPPLHQARAAAYPQVPAPPSCPQGTRQGQRKGRAAAVHPAVWFFRKEDRMPGRRRRDGFYSLLPQGLGECTAATASPVPPTAHHHPATPCHCRLPVPCQHGGTRAWICPYKQVMPFPHDVTQLQQWLLKQC